MNFDFTVVTAAYNSEKYLDDYFESILMKQSYEKGQIRIILVDDGSTDDTKKITEKWMSKCPGRVRYYCKKNGGQGSARNLGLAYAETEWITFIDSDDFVDEYYFENVANSLEDHPEVVMVCCNNIRYNEGADEYTDTHFLRYRFAQGDRFFQVADEELFPQHSAALAFFRKSVIDEFDVLFPENLRISFEDALFVGRYLKNCHEGSIGFIASAKYYARRRADGSSTTDSSHRPEYYAKCIKDGHLALLKEYRKLGAVPKNIQRTVLYDLTWRLKEHVDGPSKISCLTDEENEQYVALLKEVFSYIDMDVIQKAPATVFWFAYKAGIAKYFKSQEINSPYVYIDHLDTQRKEMTFRLFDAESRFERNGCEVKALEVRWLKHTIFGEPFVTEVYARLPYDRLTDSFAVYSASGAKCIIKYKSKQYTDKTVLDFVAGSQKRRLRYIQIADTWLVSDLLDKADDNGEHFYRFLKEEHPEQRAFYVLDKRSPDWPRLESEGFELLAFGSKTYERELRHASVIVSSQILGGAVNYFKDRYRDSKKFVFLQHGTIKDDLSAWLNKYWIDLMVTSSAKEYESITAENSGYRIFESQVILSGQARHDGLLKANETIETEKIVLIAPTWRKELVGGLIGDTGEREILESFRDSVFCRTWSKLLNSTQLKELCDRFGYRIVFAPHPNIAEYAALGFFGEPDYVELKDGNSSWQIEFAKSAMMITDYSSNAFEMAFLKKQTLYYQFDKESFFQGHTYNPGYFDYSRDGFGPIAATEDDLLSLLESFFSKESFGEPYSSNIDNCFAYRDGKACERIYARIKQITA